MGRGFVRVLHSTYLIYSHNTTTGWEVYARFLVWFALLIAVEHSRLPKHNEPPQSEESQF